MGDRKRRGAAPTLEPMEGRDLLSGLLVALHPANVPYLTPAQVAATAAKQAHAAEPGLGRSAAAARRPARAGSTSAAPARTRARRSRRSPILGTGTPTAAELAREKFHARFSGPLSIQPGRFSDQATIIFMRGLGGSTPNFFLHGDYWLAIVIPTGFNPRHPAGTGGDPTAPGTSRPSPGSPSSTTRTTTRAAWSGWTCVADPTSFDAKGRPTRLTFTADPNVYGGIFFVDSAVRRGQHHLPQEHARRPSSTAGSTPAA